MYSVRFRGVDSIDMNAVKVGRRVYSVPSQCSFVFTEKLKQMKGTDASNMHDEEPGEDEMEFSDDEKEAEYKRSKKQK